MTDKSLTFLTIGSTFANVKDCKNREMKEIELVETSLAHDRESCATPTICFF